MCEALVDLARGQGFGLLHADVLFEDVFVLGVLARFGRLQLELEYGDYSVAIHLDDGLRADTPVQRRSGHRSSGPFSLDGACCAGSFGSGSPARPDD